MDLKEKEKLMLSIIEFRNKMAHLHYDESNNLSPKERESYKNLIEELNKIIK